MEERGPFNQGLALPAVGLSPSPQALVRSTPSLLGREGGTRSPLAQEGKPWTLAVT